MSAQLKPKSSIDCSPEEWQARVDLACCYRAVEHMGWHKDSVYNHISLRVPGPEKHFLINPFGLMYQEITASNLLKIDLDANKITPSPYPVYAAGFVVHSPIHRLRDDVHCIIHTHSNAGMAVACQKEGLLPLSLAALMLLDQVAYHDCDGLVDDPDQCEGLARALGDKSIMIMRNHGLLACGRTVGETFRLMRNLETACEVQIMAQAAGHSGLQIPPKTVLDKISKQVASTVYKPKMMGTAQPTEDVVWAAMRRRMEQIDPGFAD